LRDLLAAREEVKGEVVLVVEGASEPAAPAEDAETLFASLAAAGLTRREAVKETARRLGLPAREVYRRVLGRDDE
jgi:16S rRNA (cytidine1402-2'-O)-methyltransferase